MSLRHRSVDTWPTRDRILYEASRLIAARGFHGATTREIAERVGIKQPSMFSHFASKQTILEALLVFDLTIPGQQAERFAAESASAASRLYRYAEWDLGWYQEMPFDLRGMHEDLVSLPGLERFHDELARWTAAIQRILADGVDAGEFRADAVAFVPPLLETLSWEFVRSSHKEAAATGVRLFVADGAGFILRGLLTDPVVLDRVRAQANEEQVS